MNNAVDVSVIVATYKREEELKRALLSLGEQTLDSFEIIVADDRSGGYSSTKIREALMNDVEECVKADIPNYLYPYYDVMKDAVMKVAEEEFKKHQRARKMA
jgi:GT2 family glycosyltransferase